ncbi:UNVERIFIED_CONTAM: hypothetical protein Slati_1496500 [Sesamum latifolium]|uniref:Uncharacterized protein n=1 Tax=Sesamum latifolium TaxID=2727402 RepID=A0AAW2X900_9LAMI
MRDFVAPTRRTKPCSGEASKKKLEDRVEHLLGEVVELKESKKEAMGRYQQAEKEVKRLQREAKAQ